MQSEPVFVNLVRSLGIGSQPCGPVRQSYLSYRPTRLHRLAESIPGIHKRLQIRALVVGKYKDLRGRNRAGMGEEQGLTENRYRPGMGEGERASTREEEEKEDWDGREGKK